MAIKQRTLMDKSYLAEYSLLPNNYNIDEIWNFVALTETLHIEPIIGTDLYNGNYINAENLSLGTIDQLYLALRLASIEEITEETMPIILDEAFAYYDNERLKNILEYMSKEYKNRQIIIFTCTNREKSILNSLEINYNLVTL